MEIDRTASELVIKRLEMEIFELRDTERKLITDLAEFIETHRTQSTPKSFFISIFSLVFMWAICVCFSISDISIYELEEKIQSIMSFLTLLFIILLIFIGSLLGKSMKNVKRKRNEYENEKNNIEQEITQIQSEIKSKQRELEKHRKIVELQ
jgi:ABC-type multidrug transport system fused ATPase/permease subunit